MQNHPVCRGEELDQAITCPSSVSQHAPDQQSCSTYEQDIGSSVDEQDFGKTSNPSSATTPIESQPSSGQKLHYYETIRPTSEDAATSREQPIKPWTPSILRIGPLVGLLAIVLAFCLTCASYAILHFSDGELVISWRYQPSVYLAILTAVSNKALAFATIHGTIITFWRAALRGTSLGDLHRNWNFGLFTYKALTAGRHFNLLAFACLARTLVVLDGPLLQRASSVRVAPVEKPVPLNVSITPEIPAYFTGMAGFNDLPIHQAQDFQPPFLPIYYDWSARKPMQSAISGCPGKCRATVRAPALAVDECWSEMKRKDFTVPLTAPEVRMFNEGCVVPTNNQSVFRELFRIHNGTTEAPTFETRISDDAVTKHCIGNVNRTVCSMVSAIGEYDVEINAGIITFVEPPSYPKIVARANNTAITEETIKEFSLLNTAESRYSDMPRTTLGGIANGANIAYNSMEALVMTNSDPTAQPAMYPAPNQYVFQHLTNYAQLYGPDHDCAPSWKDPRDEVMAALNELMFRTGLYTAKQYNRTYLELLLDPGLEIEYKVEGTQIGNVEVFQSDMAYFAGAAVVELIAMLAILLTYYGWWEFGRTVSLSPLEIAKAFNAPLLAAVPSNVNGRQIAHMEGKRMVQYGEIVGPGGSPNEHIVPFDRQLLFADKGRVASLRGSTSTMS